MNEKVTNLTPNIQAEKYSDSAEFKFNEQFYIAEGAAGLLAHVACHKELDGIPESVMASATYSLQDAIGKIGKMFENLHEHCLALQRQNTEEITSKTMIEAVNLANNISEDNENNTSPNIKKHGPECEFNHQHIIAEGVAGTLFSASSSPTGSMNNPVINSTAYALESAIREMNKCFQAQLHEDVAKIEEMRAIETTRQIEIMELAAEFDDDHPQLRLDSIDAIKDGTTVEAFQEHALRAISLKNANPEHNVQ